MQMVKKKLGRQTVLFENPPSVAGYAAVVGKKEGNGPIGAYFDVVSEDTAFGEKTWEKAESRMQKDALGLAVNKAGVSLGAIEYIFAGDLLNQCVGTAFGLRDSSIPLFGLYGACSTMAEGLILSAMAIDGGFAGMAAALTSSHFCSSERQYRLPLEYGGQRTPCAQWTVTGSGAVILKSSGTGGVSITRATTGKIVDLGIKDAANMGAAMAPAARDTITAFFSDSGLMPSDIDLVVTGDLGVFGSEILLDLLKKDGFTLSSYADCGVMIFDPKTQDTHSGGSGCGCSASVLCGYLIPELEKGRYKSILFCGTGALLSPVTTQQGESIPGICHAVLLEKR